MSVSVVRLRRVAAVAVAGTVAVALVLSACAGGGTGASSGAGGQQEMRTVEHALGATEIPVDPQRVVLMNSAGLDIMIALGIVPVGAALWGGISEVPDYVSAHLPDDFTILGTSTEPNLEAVAALEPDLIIGIDNIVSDNLSVLEGIAPTVAYHRRDEQGVAVGWTEHITELGELLDLEDEAAQRIAAFEERVAEVDAHRADTGETIAMLRARSEEVRFYDTTSTLSSNVLQSMQHVTLLDPTFGQPVEDGAAPWLVISTEMLTEIPSDWVYIVPDSDADLEALQAQPLWEQVPAVQADQVCVAEEFAAWFQPGPLAAEIVASEVETCLTQG
ncbi:ABC transporter substrate-binding protein [Ruania halotolerans]|uniref:ABC transporter substrate-binding protein n=1 Tax=Ruania halotolerans TaxID=2897773 RepID=UPI001E5C94FF|nr:iron-siderophore ABC transporter substrate-binding protein [Ruania halotolerans]UFU05658.1 iron-siderophore ABC transporter substrate-binding protein [Ruania halotolerans]